MVLSSSTSFFRTIAVAGGLATPGTGSAALGAFIARALLKEGANVIVLGRPSSADSPSAKELAALGATIRSVDYDSPASLADALQNVEVVISTLSGGGVRAQTPLAVAAQKAGVKLFLPAEFGIKSIDLPPSSPLYYKTALQVKLKEIGLPALLVFNGPFADWIPIILSVENNKIHIIGEGKTDISFTSRNDIASFLAHILTHLSSSELIALNVLPIEASRTSFLALSKLLIARNPSATVVHESRESALKRFHEEGDFFAWLKVVWDRGEALSAQKKDDLKNGLWPEWNPTPVEDYL